MGSQAGLAAVVDIIRSTRDDNAVVVSAMAGTTAKLLRLIDNALAGKAVALARSIKQIKKQHIDTARSQIHDVSELQKVELYIHERLDRLQIFLSAIRTADELAPDLADRVLAVGERLSSRLLVGILHTAGIAAEQVDLETSIPSGYSLADQRFYLTAEKNFARIFRKIIKQKKVPVATGYFGRVPGGMLASVGRGYSDFCAALIAAGLQAERLEIWTDVSGIMTADPRTVSHAKIIDHISFEAAAELAHFGAKVIHPQSIHPATRAGIPVWIKNTFRAADRGTEVTAIVKKLKNPVTAITSKKGITIVNIASYRMLMQYGYLARLFEIFARHKISIDVVSTSEVSVSVAIEDIKHVSKITAELKQFSKVCIKKNKAIVCLVGMGIKHMKGIAGEIFTTLGRAGISVDQISQGASELNVTFIVNEKDADKAVLALHTKFFT